MATKERVNYFLERLQGKKIAVIGDSLLDGYHRGPVERLNPEYHAATLLRITERTDVPGGAANVAANLARLGAQVKLYTRIGRDEKGDLLVKICEDRGIGVRAIRTGNTPYKLRFYEQERGGCLLRADYGEHDHPVALEMKETIELMQCLEADTYDAFACADYNKGMYLGLTGEALAQQSIDLARRMKIPVVVDPKPANAQAFRGATVIRPNFNEAREITGLLKETDEQKVAAALHERLSPDHTVITRGNKGMVIYSDQGLLSIPTVAKQVVDVTGAGDTVIACITGGLALGMSLEDSCHIANYAAGVVCGKAGTATVSPDELLEAVPD